MTRVVFEEKATLLLQWNYTSKYKIFYKNWLGKRVTAWRSRWRSRQTARLLRPSDHSQSAAATPRCCQHFLRRRRGRGQEIPPRRQIIKLVLVSRQREPAQRRQQTHLSLPYRQTANKRRKQGIFRDSKTLLHVFVLLSDLLHRNSIQFLCVSLDEDEEEKSLPPPVDTRIITFCVWGQHIPKLILLLKPADSLHVLCCVFRRQHSRVKNRTSS